MYNGKGKAVIHNLWFEGPFRDVGGKLRRAAGLALPGEGAALGARFFFALPHHPWQRGTNENTNGLLREYFPKRKPLDNVREPEVKKVYDKINRRPRKRLGYRTSHEAHYGKSLHLI